MASHRLKCAMRGALAAFAVVVAIGLTPAPPAYADPELPNNATEAMRQLQELAKETEAVTEDLHEVKDKLSRAQDETKKANESADQANRLGAQAREQEGVLREYVDRIANASFEGARLNQLSALLLSKSPGEFLDKMAVLDLLAGENKDVIDKLQATIKQAEDATKRAADAKEKAHKATEEASRLQADLEKRSKDLEERKAKVQQRYDRLTGAERDRLRGPVDNSIITIPPDSGIAGAALQHALSKRGARYVYGAEGPDTFDCSGLIYWAYKRIGVNLPRSSAQQARAGVAVPRNAMKPGDLVAYPGHIGIYVGDGKMLHAPTTGDVVKIAPLQKNITAVRRVL